MIIIQHPRSSIIDRPLVQGITERGMFENTKFMDFHSQLLRVRVED